MGCWLSTRWLPPLRPTSTLGMYSRRRQACFVHGYLSTPAHSRATHLGGYGTPVLYRCSAYGSAGYRPPGIPVLVGSDTFGRVQSGIPTQRPGPETRNTVILGCSTSKSELSIAVCQPVSRGCYASRTGYGGPGLKWSRLTSAMDEEPTRCMLLSRG